MGRFGDWIRKIFGGNGNPGIVGSAVNKYTGSGLTGAEMAANQFSHNEAELARQWQEDFYNQYQSPAAQVRQYQEAGLNPALMYGSAPSASPVSSPSPSSVSPSSESLLSLLPGLSRMKAEIENIREDTNLKRDQARATRAQALIDEIDSQTRQALNESTLEINGQRIRDLSADVALKEIEAEFKPDLLEQQLSKGNVEVRQLQLGISKALLEMQQLSQDIELTKARVISEQFMPILMAAQAACQNANAGYLSSETLFQDIENFRYQNGVRPGTNLVQLPAEAFNLFTSGTAKIVGGIVDGVKKIHNRRKSRK